MDRARYSTSSFYPCDIDCSETPSLCIFYAVASLMVIFLAISLLWSPFLILISEVNTIITRVVIYFNNQFLGIKNSTFFDPLEDLVNSPKLIVAISLMCFFYVLYQASCDFLLSAACYIATLPDKQPCSIKQLILEVIVKLLELKGNTPNDNRPSPRRIEL